MGETGKSHMMNMPHIFVFTYSILIFKNAIFELSANLFFHLFFAGNMLFAVCFLGRRLTWPYYTV
jgi:hypothetical protein